MMRFIRKFCILVLLFTLFSCKENNVIPSTDNTPIILSQVSLFNTNAVNSLIQISVMDEFVNALYRETITKTVSGYFIYQR